MEAGRASGVAAIALLFLAVSPREKSNSPHYRKGSEENKSGASLKHLTGRLPKKRFEKVTASHRRRKSKSSYGEGVLVLVDRRDGRTRQGTFPSLANRHSQHAAELAAVDRLLGRCGLEEDAGRTEATTLNHLADTLCQQQVDRLTTTPTLFPRGLTAGHCSLSHVSRELGEHIPHAGQSNALTDETTEGHREGLEATADTLDTTSLLSSLDSRKGDLRCLSSANLHHRGGNRERHGQRAREGGEGSGDHKGNHCKEGQRRDDDGKTHELVHFGSLSLNSPLALLCPEWTHAPPINP